MRRWLRWVKADSAVFDTIALMIEISSPAWNEIFCAVAGNFIFMFFMVVLSHKGENRRTEGCDGGFGGESRGA